ncbi:hypothetical protein SBOR_1270 [Sclerotinia borealis F-4128]|uniref:Beta-ketoacyl synthase n=1 Tax=Sclerotinia borealis (strain F-4128) TaxID=1432307 RepID=W9CNN4_SCLBF|nr:hypothetical protein SBOR_1270 [Sclerotinia borealis F-4128]
MQRDDMTASGEKGDSSSSSMAPTNQIQMDIIKPALQFGGLSALSGTIFGGFSGILVSRTPVLFAVASSIQWGVIGTTFWGTRTALLSRYKTASMYPTSQEKALSTAIAASLAGATGGILRGPKNILPGFVVFGAAGYVGQRIYDAVDERKMEELRLAEGGKKESGESWMNSRWVPWKKLTDDEYEGMLKERLLKVDAEIAILEDNLEALRGQQNNEARKLEGINGKKL